MKRLVVIIGLVACVLPASAAARRGVSGPAKTPIVRVGLGRNVPVQCAAVYISTVSRFWASVMFHPQRGFTATCQQFGSNGVVILHHVRGQWRFVTAGSAATCPIRGLPARIATDLRFPCIP